MSYSEKLYRYDDPIALVVNQTTLYLDNRPMNNRKLKAHKGVTNELIFHVTDKDRKKQNLFTETITAHIINPTNKRRLLSKDLEPVSELGKAMLLLTDGDMQNINSGLYFLHLTYTNDIIQDRAFYSDQNNNVRLELEVTEQVVQDPVPTQVNDSFLQTGNTELGDAANTFVSSALLGNLDKNFQNAQHTVAVYPNAYTGQVTVQGSCIIGTPDSDDASAHWFDVTNIDISDSSNVTHTSFSVNCNWVRVVSKPLNGTLDKIMLRN